MNAIEAIRFFGIGVDPIQRSNLQFHEEICEYTLALTCHPSYTLPPEDVSTKWRHIIGSCSFAHTAKDCAEFIWQFDHAQPATFLFQQPDRPELAPEIELQFRLKVKERIVPCDQLVIPCKLSIEVQFDSAQETKHYLFYTQRLSTAFIEVKPWVGQKRDASVEKLITLISEQGTTPQDDVQ